MANPCAASCGKVGHLICRGCVNAPTYLHDTALPTYYCSPACQKFHLGQHKDRCKMLQSRKMVHRAAKVIQDLYYLVLRKSHRLEIDTLFVHTRTAGSVAQNSIICEVKPGSVSSNARDELAALTASKCTMAVAAMGPSIRTMLKDEPVFT